LSTIALQGRQVRIELITKESKYGTFMNEWGGYVLLQIEERVLFIPVTSIAWMEEC